MSRKLTINPVTRIEGHASVELDIDDSNTITGAAFKVMDFRGFEAFLQGMQVEMMPTITARICGTCPQTHHLAAAKAVDKVFGVQIPPAATLLRNILNLGGIIHSHAVHLFVLAGPDLLLGMNSDPAMRNIIGLVEKFPDVSKKALRLRSIESLITEYVGGRSTHPVAMVAGGIAKPLGAEKIEKLRAVATEGLEIGQELVGVIKGVLQKGKDTIPSLTLESSYMGTVTDGALDLYQGDIRLRKPNGEHFDFSEDSWSEHIIEKTIPGSYGKVTICKNGGDPVLYRVGPLARLNCADRIDTPLAQQELETFRQIAGNPCHHTVMYHYARLVELVYALEKLHELVNNDEIASGNVRAPLGTPKNAAAHVEAPRGVLIHDYKVDENAIVTGANLLVATQQNIAAINATVRMSAQRFIDQADEHLLNAIEFGIRCYDPCLSCATHRVGEMKMNVIVRQNGKIYRQVRR